LKAVGGTVTERSCFIVILPCHATVIKQNRHALPRVFVIVRQKLVISRQRRGGRPQQCALGLSRGWPRPGKSPRDRPAAPLPSEDRRHYCPKGQHNSRPWPRCAGGTFPLVAVEPRRHENTSRRDNMIHKICESLGRRQRALLSPDELLQIATECELGLIR